jgi:hypothetical protein
VAEGAPVNEQSRLRNAYKQCRAVLGDPRYSPELSATLIGWLREPDAAVSDVAGRALAALGLPAFNDLLAYVSAPGVALSPNAVWALGLFPDGHAQLLPLLRSWAAGASGDLELQCAVSLAGILVARRAAGHAADPADVAACRLVLERDAVQHLAARVHLRGLLAGLGLSAGVPA